MAYKLIRLLWRIEGNFHQELSGVEMTVEKDCLSQGLKNGTIDSKNGAVSIKGFMGMAKECREFELDEKTLRSIEISKTLHLLSIKLHS